MATLYFARHGESEANVARIFSNRALPHRLTENGVQHARNLAELFRGRGVEELWCSPVPRAVETATIVGASLGLVYQVTEALREFDVGRYDGMDSPEGWEEYVAVTRAWVEGYHERRVGGGESLTEIVDRLRAFLQEFRTEDDRRVGLIGHGGLYRMALPQVFANVSPEFAAESTLGYGSLIIAAARDGKLFCLEWDSIRVP